MAMFGAGFRGGLAFPQIESTMTETFAPTAPVQPATSTGYGGAARAIAGYIGDALLQANRMQPIYAPTVQRRQEREQQLADEQRRNAAQLDMWRQQQSWKQANPDPRYFEANNGDQYVIGPDGQPQRIFADPSPKVSMTPVKNADGTTTLYPTVNGQVMTGQAAPTPSAPVGKLIPYQGGAGSGPRSFPR